MRRSILFIACAALACCGLLACANKKPERPKPQPDVTYTVKYDPGEGTGDVTDPVTYKTGTVIKLAQNPFVYENHVFDGWTFDGKKYAVGDSYKVERDTVFVAAWKNNETPPVLSDSEPHFSQEWYSYDKLGGGALELPFVLDGAKLYYVRINGEIVEKTLFDYDSELGAISIDENYVLDLELGSYSVTAITDSRGGNKNCVVEITQSLKTSFDDVTEKHFVYGRDECVTFSVDFNRTMPSKITQNGIDVPSEYITYDEDSVTLAAEWVSKSTVGKYKMELSNHDRYEFTVTSNIIFATDYDVSTEHSDVRSNTGMNPYYQYYDTVEIADSPSIMNSGKALKITPNQSADLHNYITLKTPECSYSWHRVEFKKDKVYYISFDYMTHATVGGELYFRGADKSTVKKVPMLYGGENDDIVHHFEALYNYDEIGVGVRIYAEFINGGEVWIDNYKIVELDAVPAFNGGEYNAAGDYVLSFDPIHYDFTVEIDGESTEYVYDASAKTVTVSKSVLSGFTCGNHRLSIVTAIGSFETVIRITDDRIAEFVGGVTEYRSLSQTEVKVYGSFEQTIELVSLKQKVKEYENAFAGWNFTRDNDTITDFASQATLTPGLDGTGYLKLPKALLDKFWGEVTFIAEFDNGNSAEFTVNSKDVLMYTDYDISVLKGYLGDSYRSGSPLNSGLWGSSIADVEQREVGNKAFYIRSSAGSADSTAFTTRYSAACTYDWFRIYGNVGECYRVTFDYQISGFGEKDVVFRLTFSDGEDINAGYFADYDELDGTTVVHYLIADGKVHTFDSGWFTHSDGYRATKINFPTFEAADGKFIMFDNYCVVKSSEVSYIIGDMAEEYDKMTEQPFTFDVGAEKVYSVKADGAELDYEQSGNTVTVAASSMKGLELGKHDFEVTTETGIFRKQLTVVSTQSSAELLQTSAQFGYLAPADIKFYGNFTSDVRLVSLKQKAKVVDSGYSGGWNFAKANDTETNFADAVTLSAGTDGTGYIVLPKEFISKFWGTVSFDLEFNNGSTAEITVEITDVLAFTNYEESNMLGYFGDALRSWTPFSSGLDGNITVEDFGGDGNKALFLRSAGGADTTMFTTKYMEYGYDWFRAIGDADDSYRVTFDYRIVGFGSDEVRFDLFLAEDESVYANCFGQFDGIAAGNTVYAYLSADGNTHTFDSGWFTHGTERRLSKVNFPAFGADSGKYIVFDNYRIVRSKGIRYILEGVGDRSKYKDVPFTFDTAGQTVVGVWVSGNKIDFVQEGSTVTVSSEALDALECKKYELKVETDIGAVYKCDFAVTDDRVSTLKQTSAAVVHGQSNAVKLEGEFDASLNVISVKRSGSDEWDSSRVTPAAMDTGYITVSADGLTLDKALVDQAYGTTEYTVAFDNGKSVGFTLTSNLLYYTNYDETCIFDTRSGNMPSCQDAAMWSVEAGENGNRLEYRPERAVLGHSVGAINGSGDANSIFTYKSPSRTGVNWMDYDFAVGRKMVFFFDYVIENPDNVDHNIIFAARNRATGKYVEIKIDGSGRFEQVFDYDIDTIMICCPVASPDMVKNVCMRIDNFGFGIVE